MVMNDMFTFSPQGGKRRPQAPSDGNVSQSTSNYVALIQCATDRKNLLKNVEGQIRNFRNCCDFTARPTCVQEFEQGMKILEDVYLSVGPDQNQDQLCQYAYEMLDMDRSGIHDYVLIDEKYRNRMSPILEMLAMISKFDTGQLNQSEADTHANILTVILEFIYQMKDLVYSDQRMRMILKDKTNVVMHSFSPYRWTFITKDPTGATKQVHELMMFVLAKLQYFGYRRHDEDCYMQQKLPNGTPTHAWMKKVSIEEFIYSICRKEDQFLMWSILNQSGDMCARVKKMLMQPGSGESEFQELKFCRWMFSFNNGLWDAKQCIFYPYYVQDPLDGTMISNSKLDSKMVAINFFDMPVDPTWLDMDWTAIPTPRLESIFKCQQLYGEVMDWVIVMVLGRPIFEVNDLDQWQVCPFLKGCAGVGKSTLGNILSYYYPEQLVSVLSSNVEEKFGLYPIVKTLLCLCFEVKKDFKLSSAEFQSMVSGEKMSIPVKNHAAPSLVWKVPLVLAGNETFKWLDSQGALTRRLVMIEFTKRIPKNDINPKMLQHIKETEMAAIIIKSSLGYKAMVNKYGNRDIWLALPQYFEETKKRMRALTSPLVDFLSNGTGFEIFPNSKSYFMSIGDFTLIYNDFRTKKGATKAPDIDTDARLATLEEFGLTEERACLLYKEELKDTTFIFGIRLKPVPTVSDG